MRHKRLHNFPITRYGDNLARDFHKYSHTHKKDIFAMSFLCTNALFALCTLESKTGI